MNSKSNTTHLIKTANSFLVLDVIRKSDSVTVEDIVRITHLSRPTVLSIIDDWTQRDVIKRSGYAESNVGRQPVLYAINNTTHFAIGIDFEFPPIHLVITDLSGNIRYQKNWDCSFKMEKDNIIQLLIENIQLAIDALDITCDNIIGIGLGIPGTVDANHNTSEIISRIPEWNKTPLSEILSQHFPIPIYVRNDAHLMSLAAQDNLKLANQDFMYIAYRTGIGMAIIRDGSLFEGCHGNSGYIGHTTVDINGDLCSCGNRGCLETFASKTTIENKYIQARNLDTRIPFDTLLQLADEGEPIALDIFKTAGQYFGIAIANSVKLLDISTVIVDDLSCKETHIFIQSIEETVNRYCSSYALQPIKIIPHQLKKEEYALGAALFILDTFFQKPKLKLSV
ncbi:MAG: ROK family transcriptional regulator [Lachnospiraceae bacterium]|jgi:predicted NBD/HSP70 family sugar kinase|nr:ROK family transcriptional regulator [Lachnospiraceae bacterium]